MERIDPYDILGVSKTASEEEIKKAYRNLARQFHPDVNPDKQACESLFKQIAEAYDILINVEKRRHYDIHTHDRQRQAAPGTSRSTGERSFGESPFATFDVEMDQESFLGRTGFTPFDDPSLTYARFFGQDLGYRGTPQRGTDLEHVLTLSFSQAFCGVTVSVSVLNRTVDVRIPPGIDSGMRIRVGEHGAPGLRGGPPGDLYLNIMVEPHECFRRGGGDVFLDVCLTGSEALNGGRFEVPCPDGRIALVVPPGTPSGSEFRFRGGGFPSLNRGGRGDFYVRTHII